MGLSLFQHAFKPVLQSSFEFSVMYYKQENANVYGDTSIDLIEPKRTLFSRHKDDAVMVVVDWEACILSLSD